MTGLINLTKVIMRIIQYCLIGHCAKDIDMVMTKNSGA